MKRGHIAMRSILAALVVTVAMSAAAQTITDGDTIKPSSKPRFEVIDGDIYAGCIASLTGCHDPATLNQRLGVDMQFFWLCTPW